jgi:hypothetical protein
MDASLPTRAHGQDETHYQRLWRTVETFWNAKGTAFFKLSCGAQIKVRSRFGWFVLSFRSKALTGIR